MEDKDYIKQLKEENKKLKEEIRQLKSKLNWLQGLALNFQTQIKKRYGLLG